MGNAKANVWEKVQWLMAGAGFILIIAMIILGVINPDLLLPRPTETHQSK
jgi:hypothetical protein